MGTKADGPNKSETGNTVLKRDGSDNVCYHKVVLTLVDGCELLMITGKYDLKIVSRRW